MHRRILQRWPFLLAGAMVAALPVSLPAAAETREAYLESLRMICAPGCKGPRDLLRSARKEGRGGDQDIAGIIDVADVSMWNGKYMLHSDIPDALFGPRAGSQTPLSLQPLTEPNIIVIEMDEATFFNLLNVPTPQEQAAMQAESERNGGIVVERDRRRNLTKPTLATLRTMFRNRRVVVRGKPRLEAVFVGARRDFRRKKLFIELDDAGDLAFLPRYDRNGEPIFDGPLEGLRTAYAATGH
ncbi:hypothetical protein [Erythrobacter dokdonensis]|uniref:hypothetical protein n=1 Tax=Erythrobacter dokdonensis TaxID=328225 RepID=UPI000B1C7D9E|nr:hypothetical protein [Erythrobacter dokdonensis]